MFASCEKVCVRLRSMQEGLTCDLLVVQGDLLCKL